jgi:hypothetical protein
MEYNSDVCLNGAILIFQERKKFRQYQSAGRVMITVFWDYGGVILMDVKLKATTINFNAYISKLKSSGSV